MKLFLLAVFMILAIPAFALQPGPNDVYVHVVDVGAGLCTNRHGTNRVYGFRDGRIRVQRQQETEKSCAYDGTHY